MSGTNGFLSPSERVSLHNLMRKRKIAALERCRANALLLLDAGWNESDVGAALFMDISTIKTWRANFQHDGVGSIRLSDYSPREGHLTRDQEQELAAYFQKKPPRDSCAVRRQIEQAFGLTFSRSGAIALMKRLGFVYKKPKSVPRVASEVEQQRHIDAYEALTRGLEAQEAVVFVDAVHPEHQARPAFGWFHKSSKPILPATTGRRRLNIHGALNLETGQLTYVEDSKICAQTTLNLLKRIETAHADSQVVHVFLDNARYHHANLLKPWLKRAACKIKLHFLPTYCPHLNPIERLWGLMHRSLTHNKCYESFADFLKAVTEFLDGVQGKWSQICDQISDNFRFIASNAIQPSGCLIDCVTSMNLTAVIPSSKIIFVSASSDLERCLCLWRMPQAMLKPTLVRQM